MRGSQRGSKTELLTVLPAVGSCRILSTKKRLLSGVEAQTSPALKNWSIEQII